MKIKKNIILSLLISSMSLQAFAEDNSWWRDADDYSKIWAQSSDSGYQALVSPLDNKDKNQAITFTLILSHKSFCGDKDDSFSGEQLMIVNDRKVSFQMSCFKNEFLNLHPSTEQGDKFVLEEFNSYRNKNITFVIPYKDSPDWIFNITTKDFRKYYSSLKTYIKETIK